MKTSILFDLDGTLIDSTQAILNSFSFAFLENKNENYDEKKIKSLIGISLDEIFKELMVDDIDKYINSYKKRYKEIYLEQSFVLESTKEALKEAKSFAKLGVVTNKGGFFTAKLLKHLGIFDFFEVFINPEAAQYFMLKLKPSIITEFIGNVHDLPIFYPVKRLHNVITS